MASVFPRYCFQRTVINTRLVIKVAGIVRGTAKLAEYLIPTSVSSQEYQMVPPWTLLFPSFRVNCAGAVRAVIAKIEFLSNNRPNIILSACLVKLRNSRHAAMICNCECSLSIVMRLLHQIGYTCQAI